MLKKISIGQMAKLNNISIQTLHHYDKIGLLSPNYTDPVTSYRYYTIKQCACLDFIKYLKYMGFTLREMKEILSEKDTHSISHLFDDQLKLIDRKVNELKQMKRTLEVARENYNECMQIAEMGLIEEGFFPERRIYCYNGNRDIYEDDLETYEYILRELRKQAHLHQFPTSNFCNVGTITRMETIKQRKLASTEIFMFVDDDYIDTQEIERIPAHDYVSIYCDDFSKEKEYAFKLVDYINEHGLEMVGDYICEVIFELPDWIHNERQMIMRLQIPVKKIK